MTEQLKIEASSRAEAAGFAPPHAPLPMPKQVLSHESGLLRRVFGVMVAMPAWRRASHRRAG
jgi:hypothetical protein